MSEIRYPNITAPTEAGQLLQVKSYLHQLVDQLNWAMKTIESGSGSAVDAKGNPISTSISEKDDPISNFNSIKGLIIKSADIVTAYYEQIDNLLKLSGEYAAEASFPEGSAKFVENTNLTVEANSKDIAQIFSDIQEIVSDIAGIDNTLIEVNAHIKSGLLYYDDEGVPVYGLEIGQRNEIDGEEVFNKYARFVADKLSFYDQNGSEVAYISDYKLFITHAEITGSLTLGAFRIDTSRGFTLKYVGRG